MKIIGMILFPILTIIFLVAMIDSIKSKNDWSLTLVYGGLAIWAAIESYNSFKK